MTRALALFSPAREGWPVSPPPAAGLPAAHDTGAARPRPTASPRSSIPPTAPARTGWMRSTSGRRSAEPECAAASTAPAGRETPAYWTGRIPVGEVAVKKGVAGPPGSGTRCPDDRLDHPGGCGRRGAPGDRWYARAIPNGGRGGDPPGRILGRRPPPGPPARQAGEFSGVGGRRRSAEGRHAVATRACPDVEPALRRRTEDAGAVPEDGGYPDHP